MSRCIWRTGHAGDQRCERQLDDDPRPQASAENFRAAGIPLLRGREFTTTDADSTRVVIINQTFADEVFADENPIGKRIAGIGDFNPMSSDWRAIVGVVGITRDGGQDAAPRSTLFMPSPASGTGMMMTGSGLVVRAQRDASTLVPAARRIIRRIATTAAIENVKTVAQIRDESISPRHLNAVLVSSFGILAVFIATVGIAGVLAFSA